MVEFVIPLRHNARPTTSPLIDPPDPEEDALYINHKTKKLWTKDDLGIAYELNPITPPPILFDLSDLPQVTIINNTTVQVGSGVAVCRSIVDPNSTRTWNRYIGIAPVTASLPVGFSGNSAYVFLATNGTGDSASDTAFISSQNPPNNTPSGFNWVRMLCPLFVESGVIKAGTHLPGLQRFKYDVDWSTPINPVTTAGGGLITVGVPIYPLVMEISCTAGEASTASASVASRFSRNSVNPAPAITEPFPALSGFNGDIGNFYSGSAYIDVQASGLEISTATAQARVIRSGTYLSARLPNLKIYGYSWSK